MFAITQTLFQEIYYMCCHSPAKQTSKAVLAIKPIKFKKTAPRLEITDRLRQVKGSIECSASAVGAFLAE